MVLALGRSALGLAKILCLYFVGGLRTWKPGVDVLDDCLLVNTCCLSVEGRVYIYG